MKVLVTGGSGVIGRAAVNAFLADGHTVRLLARHADEAAREWTEGVEPAVGDVSSADGMRGAADGCDAVLHVAGIAAEEPPERTFDAVNVRGTENAIAEAKRAGSTRFVFVSSLGADRGSSGYHRSKLEAEQRVRASNLRWTIVRPGNVYGPGDEILSVLVRMVRTLPAIPVVHGGDRHFQPVWHDDLGHALARCVADETLEGEVLEMTGPDAVTLNELLDRVYELTDRHPIRVPLPQWAARAGLAALGDRAPIAPDSLTLLAEENMLDPAQNALPRFLDRPPLPLAEGLARLVDDQPEQMPDEGTGPLRRRVFAVDIEGARLSADELAARFRADFNRFVPIEASAEPGAPSRLTDGATLTLSLPARGHIQVRVEELLPRRITFATLAGHPLAGAITFEFMDVGNRVRFVVDEVSRAANLVDRLGMMLLGGAMQGATWNQVCERVVEESGGRAPAGVDESDENLDEEEARAFTDWLGSVVATRRREQENTPGPARSQPRARASRPRAGRSAS